MFVLRNLLGRAREEGRRHLNYGPRTDGFTTAASDTSLFPPTTPEADGEACLRDCEDCVSKLPAKFLIDESKYLYGHVKPFTRHLLVATGKSDWAQKVHNEDGSVMQAVAHHEYNVTGGRLMMSASNMPIPDSSVENATRVLLLPAFVFIDNVTPSNVPALINDVINTAPVNLAKPSTVLPSLPADSQMVVRQCPYDYLVLLCSHRTRDARCGQSAPIIKKELERHLRPLDLLRDLDDDRPGGVGIYFVSHVGGHKFAANVLVYRRAGTPGAEYVPDEDGVAGVEEANGAAAKTAVREAAASEAKIEVIEHATPVAQSGASPESSSADTNGSVAHANGQPKVYSDFPHTGNGELENGSAEIVPSQANDANPSEKSEAKIDVVIEPMPVANGTTFWAAENGAAQNGATENEAAQNEAVQNGATENRATENGAVQNGAVENGATQSGADQNGAVENGVPHLVNGHKPQEPDTILEEKRPEVGQCIWLSRVRPEDCENIVNYTILKGKVVKPQKQLRGGFDRCKQLSSW